MKTEEWRDGVLIGTTGEDEPVVIVRTPLDVLEALTPEEYQTIWTVAQQSPELSRWFDMMRAATEVRSDDPRTINGCAAAVQAGLLTADRVLQVFGVQL